MANFLDFPANLKVPTWNIFLSEKILKYIHSVWHDNWAWLPDECLLSIPELLFPGIELMGWNGHFVKCTNWATCNSSGHWCNGGLRKIPWGLIMRRCQRRKELQRLEKATSSLFTWGTEAQGGAGCAGITQCGSGRDVDLVSWPRTKPLSPAFKASVERGQAMDSGHWCKAPHTPSWSSAQAPGEHTCLMQGLGGQSRMHFWQLTFLSSTMRYQISYFYRPPFPFSFFYLFFILMPLSSQRQISGPGHLIAIAKAPCFFITLSKKEGLVWPDYLSLHDILVYLDFSIEIPLAFCFN